MGETKTPDASNAAARAELSRSKSRLLDQRTVRMHLGKFRVKRTLFGLIFTIGFLSVVKIVKEPTSRPKSINFKFLRYKFDANLPQNGDRRAPKRDHNLNPQVNITNSRKVKEVPSTPSDGRNEEDQDLRYPPNDINPKPNLFLSDLRSRSNLIRQQCVKLGDKLEHVDPVRDPPEGLIVDEKHKLLYCVVPKAACSSWKEFFFEIGGYGEDRTNRHKKRKQVLTYFNHLPEEKRQSTYKKLYKFVFVRHPFLRLLSAYKDKMEPNGSYERLHAHTDPQTLYFWRDRLGMDIIRTYHGKETAFRMKRHRDEYRITFYEFVRYLVEHPEHPSTKDRHWKPMHKLCFPCDIRYEFIANFETIDTDSAFIRRLVKADLPERNKHATNSSNLDYAFSYYKDIPKNIMRKLFERYKYDFMLFGYNPLPFL